MDLDLAIILSKLFLLLGCEVLISEEYYASFRNQQSELVSLLVRKIFQLQSWKASAMVSKCYQNIKMAMMMLPSISVPICAVRFVTLVAAESSAVFSLSARAPASLCVHGSSLME